MGIEPGRWCLACSQIGRPQMQTEPTTRTRVVVICATMVALLPHIGLFQRTEALPSFEVISIKPTPVERQNRLTLDYCQSSGRFLVAGTPVLWSIRYAYRLKDF